MFKERPLFSDTHKSMVRFVKPRAYGRKHREWAVLDLHHAQPTNFWTVTMTCNRVKSYADTSIVKPRPCFAWRGFLLSLCVCMRACVRLSVCKISQRILDRSTSFFVEAFPMAQGGNHSILKENCPEVRVGVWGPKFGPNDKR